MMNLEDLCTGFLLGEMDRTDISLLADGLDDLGHPLALHFRLFQRMTFIKMGPGYTAHVRAENGAWLRSIAIDKFFEPYIHDVAHKMLRMWIVYRRRADLGFRDSPVDDVIGIVWARNGPDAYDWACKEVEFPGLIEDSMGIHSHEALVRIVGEIPQLTGFFNIRYAS